MNLKPVVSSCNISLLISLHWYSGFTTLKVLLKPEYKWDLLLRLQDYKNYQFNTNNNNSNNNIKKNINKFMMCD
jgi:hypothetical protein